MKINWFEQHLPLFVMMPPHYNDLNWLLICSDNHAIGVYNPLFLNTKTIYTFIKSLENQIVHYGIRIPLSRIELLQMIVSEDLENLKFILLLDNTPINQDLSQYQPLMMKLQKHGIKIFYEVTNIKILSRITSLPIDGFIACGNEAGGPVSKLTSFILINYLLTAFDLPVIGYGGVGLMTVTGFFACGCEGVILDSVFYLSPNHPYNTIIRKKKIELPEITELFKGNEATVRIYTKNKELTGENNRLNYPDLLNPNNMLIKNLYDFTGDYLDDSVLFLGADFLFSDAFDHKSIPEIIEAFYLRIKSFYNHKEKYYHFSQDTPLAKALNQRCPIIQGPLGSISDNPRFIKLIADHNILPVVALGRLDMDNSEKIISEVENLLYDQTYGAGIIGLKMNQKVYENQIKVLSAHKTGFIIIGAGSIPLAQSLQERRFTVFLHTPYISNVIQAYQNNIRNLIVEGNESGGHISLNSSLILWEQTLYFLKHRQKTDTIINLIFAGGIFNEKSAAFIEGIIFDFDGIIQAGLHLGSALLLSDEMKEIDELKFYQACLLEHKATIVIGETVNLSTRTLRNDFSEKINKMNNELSQQSISDIEKKIEFEKCNSNGLAIAAKGTFFNIADGSYSQEKMDPYFKKNNGNFMIGDALYLYNTPFSLKELIVKLTETSRKIYKKSIMYPGIFSERINLVFDKVRLNTQFNLQKPPQVNDAVAVVGMGCILPGAQNIDQYWDNIISGKNLIIDVPPDRWDPLFYYSENKKAENKSYCKKGGFITEFTFNSLQYKIPPVIADFIDKPIKFAVYSTGQALADFNSDRYDKRKAAVIIGSTMGGDLVARYVLTVTAAEILDVFTKNKHFLNLEASCRHEILKELKKDISILYPKVTSDSIGGILTNLSAGRIGSIFDLNGANYVVDAACASALAAVDNSIKGLLNDEYDIAVCGGTDSTMYPLNYVLFSKIYALSDNLSCPFDSRADGFISGEGCGILILKKLSRAIRDQNKIYAVIRGAGSSCDGASGSIISPSVTGQALAIERAYLNAGYSPETVELIECHGTSTPVGDLAEYHSLKQVFNRYDLPRMSIPIGSVKSQIGHLKSASGAAALIKTVLALYHKKLPPSINFEKPAKDLDFENSPFYINTVYQEWEHQTEKYPRRAGVNAFGFGGVNYHMTLEAYDEAYHHELIKGIRNYSFFPAEINTPDSVKYNPPLNQPENPHTDKEWELIKNKIMSILIEKTGYPESMLNLDYKIEDNLGIDSLQKISIISTVIKVYDAPESIFNGTKIETIRDLVELLYQHKEVIRVNPIRIENTSAVNPDQNFDKENQIDYLVPHPVNEPIVQVPQTGLNRFLENDVVMILGSFNSTEFFCRTLKDEFSLLKVKTIGIVDSRNKTDVIKPDHIYSELIHTDFTDPVMLEKVLKQILETIPPFKFKGIIYISASHPAIFDRTASIKMIHEIPQKLFYCAKALLPFFERYQSSHLFFLSVTAMDGKLGFSNHKIFNPLNGMATGFFKALAKEYYFVDFKMIDLAEYTAESSRNIIEELSACLPDQEVAYEQGKRYVIYLENTLFKPQTGPEQKNSVYLVTGGARGITAEVIKNLSLKKKSRFIILGKTVYDDQIESLSELDSHELKKKKKEIYDELQQLGQDASPAAVEKKYTDLVHQLDVYKNLKAIEENGSIAEYYALDITDEKAFSDLLADLSEKNIMIDTVIHGAGIDKSKFLINQKIENIMEEARVKIIPLLILNNFIDRLKIRNIFCFGSVAGFFGNASQTGYSMANDLLNKYTAYFMNYYKINALCINWTAWKDIGMAVRDSVFLTLKDAGLTYLTLPNGINAFNKISEENSILTPAILVTAGGINNVIRTRELIFGKSITGPVGMDSGRLLYRENNFSLLNTIHYYGRGRKTVASSLLSPELNLFLDDHRIESIPYTPAVITTELAAETVCLMYPDYRINMLKDLHFYKALSFYKNELKKIYISVESSPVNHQQNTLRVQITVHDKINAPAKSDLYLTGTVILTKNKNRRKKFFSPQFALDQAMLSVDANFIYQKFENRNLLYYGPTFQLIKSMTLYPGNTLHCELLLPIERKLFIDQRPSETIIKPHLIEFALQSFGWLSLAAKKEFILPQKIHEIIFADYDLVNTDKLFIHTSFMKSDHTTGEGIIYDNQGQVVLKIKGKGTVIRKNMDISYKDI